MVLESIQEQKLRNVALPDSLGKQHEAYDLKGRLSKKHWVDLKECLRNLKAYSKASMRASMIIGLHIIAPEEIPLLSDINFTEDDFEKEERWSNKIHILVANRLLHPNTDLDSQNYIQFSKMEYKQKLMQIRGLT